MISIKTEGFLVAVLLLTCECRDMRKCLTGYMTDVQDWVTAKGTLTTSVGFNVSLDFTHVVSPIKELNKSLQHRLSKQEDVKYLSLARCRLYKVPFVFRFLDSSNRRLCDTVEYITLFGNHFGDGHSSREFYGVYLNATDAVEMTNSNGPDIIPDWGAGFHKIKFPMLKELDLRACSIQVLTDLFRGMQALTALYLGENEILSISSDAFRGLHSLRHLDLSRNIRDESGQTSIFEDPEYVFEKLENLQSLDLSFTQMFQNDANIFDGLSKKFEILSICDTGLAYLKPRTFQKTSLRLLDVSFNTDVLSNHHALNGIEDTLEVLIAEDVGLKYIDVVKNFTNLKVLKVTNNEIVDVPSEVAVTLTDLRQLYLDNNRFITWFHPIFTLMNSIELVTLQHNNINLISEEMLNDFKTMRFLAISHNNLVCSCQAKKLFDYANVYTNLTRQAPSFKYPGNVDNDNLDFERNKKVNFISFDDKINSDDHFQPKDNDEYKETGYNCEFVDTCPMESHFKSNFSFALIDYSEIEYTCLLSSKLRPVHISDEQLCDSSLRDNLLEENLSKTSRRLLALIVIPILAFPMLIFVYCFRKNFKYFILMLRNSAMLSLISRNEIIDDNKVFDYDVFVSYCNEDRNWVLDELLPHVEQDSHVSVCLHERDFQVGLSILENIVSCMDRSSSIMLIISQQFLRSQWCQFEMHLAQHRLLETRREDLILVLLEDIPRSMRPNTLHYLMMTKTYIVWPKGKRVQTDAFWRRINKSIITLSKRKSGNLSFA